MDESDRGSTSCSYFTSKKLYPDFVPKSVMRCEEEEVKINAYDCVCVDDMLNRQYLFDIHALTRNDEMISKTCWNAMLFLLRKHLTIHFIS